MSLRGTTLFTSQGAMPCQEDFALASQERGILVVADGFGGPGPGALASKTACEAVRDFLQREAGDQEATLPFVLRSYFSLAGNVLFNALIHANRKLIAANKSRGVHERGGASTIAGYLDGDLLALANVGSCEAWLARDGRWAELVVPRSYSRLSDPFRPMADPARGSPLTALGVSEDLEPEIVEVRVRKGDWLVLQTDGAGKRVLDRVLAASLGVTGGVAEAAGPLGSTLQDLVAGLKGEAFQDNAAVSIAVF